MLDRRLLFVSGKGGVGKSAVTASLAIVAARRGKRVLVIDMIESTGLAAHFGVAALGYDRRHVRPGVEAIAVARDRALDEYLRIQLRVPRAAPTRYLTRALNVLVETAPGVREIVSIGKPVYELWKGDHDLIVVDSPPLGQLMSYLGAPQTISDLVPAGVVRNQAAQLAAALSDVTATGLLLVTTAEELPVAETTETLNELDANRLIDLVGVVTNRVLPPLGVPESVVAGLPDGPHRAAATLHQSLYTEQERWALELPPGPRLPLFFGIHTAPEVTEHLADVWDGVL